MAPSAISSVQRRRCEMIYRILFIAALSLYLPGRSLAQCDLPIPHYSGSVCIGYAWARAWGCSDEDAVLFHPTTSYFNAYPSLFVACPYGTNYNVGDIIVMGLPGTPFHALSTSNGHAAYIKEIQSANTPDGGQLRLSPTGIWRDDDPIADDSHVILQQIDNEGALESRTLTLATLKSERPNDEVKGYYKLKDAAKQYSVTFQNSFTGGKIFVGKSAAGSLLNKDSPFSKAYTVNTIVDAKAITPQKIGSTTWTFASQWLRGGGLYGTSQAIQVTVSTSETYQAQFSASYSGPLVVFQNYADGASIGSVIKVNNEDKLSPTPQFPIGATAQAYSYLFVNRVMYYFSQWSTGSTSQTLTPSSDGTYTAYYTYQYVSPPADVSASSGGVGNPIKVTWEKHPSPYVTQYQISRKVKNVEPLHVVATLGPTSTSWTDYDYIMTSSYTDDLVEYAIKAHYVQSGIRDVWTDYAWTGAFAEGGKWPAPPAEKIKSYLEKNQKASFSVCRRTPSILRQQSHFLSPRILILRWTLLI
jgi:hypothetical protein